MAPYKSPSTAPLSAAKCAFITAKLAAIACVLMLMISGTSLLRGSHPGTTDLRGKPFSMVSVSAATSRPDPSKGSPKGGRPLENQHTINRHQSSEASPPQPPAMRLLT